MRLPSGYVYGRIKVFRIPMRGYESISTTLPVAPIVVPNPHEGL